MVIWWLIGRLSGAHRDIVFLLKCSQTRAQLLSVSFFLFLWSPSTTSSFPSGREMKPRLPLSIHRAQLDLKGTGVPVLVTHDDRGHLPRVSAFSPGLQFALAKST